MDILQCRAETLSRIQKHLSETWTQARQQRLRLDRGGDDGGGGGGGDDDTGTRRIRSTDLLGIILGPSFPDVLAERLDDGGGGVDGNGTI